MNAKQNKKLMLTQKMQAKIHISFKFQNRNFLTTYFRFVQPGFQEVLDVCLCPAATYVYCFDVKIPEFVAVAVVDPEISRKV